MSPLGVLVGLIPVAHISHGPQLGHSVGKLAGFRGIPLSRLSAFSQVCYSFAYY